MYLLPVCRNTKILLAAAGILTSAKNADGFVGASSSGNGAEARGDIENS
jgi:hypothetical protein